MADLRVYAAGVQVVRQRDEVPVRIYAAGVQVVRLLSTAPPTTGRRRQQQNVN